jgi:hypothetical protein
LRFDTEQLQWFLEEVYDPIAWSIGVAASNYECWVTSSHAAQF